MAGLPLPEEFKGFFDVFNRLSYGLTDSDVFDDFLLWIIAGFSPEIKWEPRNKYPKEKSVLFWELFRELVKGVYQTLKGKEWCDPFGMFYESSISSHGRRASAGQFFTPGNVVDLMVKIQAEGVKESKKIDELKGSGIRVCDPTCGSGRMLIAFHANFPGNYEYGEDIDRTCCLMTVCNMLLSGAVGEVVWHNALDPESWFGGWRVNENLRWTGVPIVRPIEQTESFAYQKWQQRKRERENKIVEIETPVIVPQDSILMNTQEIRPGTQLSLFFE